jgi:pyrophosphate--fructose-6-phosphate 1-phosphotransferase
MGRSASHIALECALQTQPNVCIISEEVEAKDMTLGDVVNYIAGIVAKRAAKGDNFGTVLIPEGLIEFIPAIKKLIKQLNDLLGANEAKVAGFSAQQLEDFIKSNISAENLATLNSLPTTVARQLMLDRDPHGNVQVSLIETEKLLSQLVGERLAEMAKAGEYNGKFSALHHFFGYEGRCADPSNFDADYCYALGYNATCLINAGVTGYMSSIRNLVKPAVQWIAGGIPITMMMNIEHRNAADKPVIQKALVRLDGAPFKKFAAKRDEWAENTCYVYPGPIQYFGPSEVCDQPSLTLQYEQKA